MEFVETVREYFDKAKYGWLMLPSGPFGRPGDNQHKLTSVEGDDILLKMVLDDGMITLWFKALKGVTIETEDAQYSLVFWPFEALRFDWTEYGSEPPIKHARVFVGGEMRVESDPLDLVRAPWA